MNFTIDCFSCCCCRWCWCGFFKEKLGRERERKKEANLVKTKGAKQRQARQGSLPLILKCYASTVVRHLLPNCLYSSLPLSHTLTTTHIHAHTHTHSLSLSLSLSTIHTHKHPLSFFFLCISHSLNLFNASHKQASFCVRHWFKITFILFQQRPEDRPGH